MERYLQCINLKTCFAVVLHTEILKHGSDLVDKLGIPIAVQPLNEEQSAFFKTVYQNPARSSNQQFVIDVE